jgi:hypothetical protein
LGGGGLSASLRIERISLPRGAWWNLHPVLYRGDAHDFAVELKSSLVAMEEYRTTELTYNPTWPA